MAKRLPENAKHRRIDYRKRNVGKLLLEKISNVNKILLLLAAACIAAILFSVCVKADTITLSGEISENYEADETTTEIILEDVTFADGVFLTLKSGVIIVLPEGTDNYISGISNLYGIEFQGSGSLKLSDGIAVWSGGIIFNHTGLIDVTAGRITAVSGDVVLNSGTVRVNNSEEGYAMSSAEGKVIINGGELITDGDYGMVAAPEISIADEVEINGQAQHLEDSDGASADVITDSSGQISSSVKAQGEDVDNGIHIETGVAEEETQANADEETTQSEEVIEAESETQEETQTTRDESQTSRSTRKVIILLVIILVVIAAVLAVCLTFASKKKSSKGKGK